MFEQIIPTKESRRKRLWSTAAGMCGQVGLMGLAVLAPLVIPQSGLTLSAITHLVAPSPPPGPTTPERPVNVEVKNHVPTFKPPDNVLYEPSKTPNTVPDIVDPQEAYAPVCANCVVGGVRNDGPVVGAQNLISDIIKLPPVAPPPVAVKPPDPVPPKPAPLRVSEMDPGKLLHRVDPVYPPLARQIRVSGVVRLEGIVGTDGHIRELTVLAGSHPLLVQAAMEAVRQWVYKPTMLNGVPVEVIAPITVTFRLN